MWRRGGRDGTLLLKFSTTWTVMVMRHARHMVRAGWSASISPPKTTMHRHVSACRGTKFSMPYYGNHRMMLSVLNLDLPRRSKFT